MRNRNKVLVGAVLGVLVASAAQAELLVDFTPITQTEPSVSFGPVNPANTRFLDDTTGFRGTGVGGSSGVHLRTPLLVTSVPGFVVVDGFTTWSDVSLSLSGLVVNAPATTQFGVISQPLGVGRFTFTSSAASGAQVLLTGTFDLVSEEEEYGAVISGLRNGTTGAILAGRVSYDGGAIFNALMQIPEAEPVGDATFNALLVVPRFTVEQNYLAPFTARVQGQFSTPVIPEPAVAMYLLPVTSLLLRRRRVSA